MLQIRKLRQVDCFFLFVMIAYAFDFGNLKYAMAWCFSAIYFLGSGLYEKRRLRGIGKEYVLVFGGITFLFAITAILQMINGFNSYAINEAVYYYTPLIFIIVYSQISEEQDVETILNYLFVLYVIVFLKNFAGQLTLANLKSISFANSYSPFESELAFVFLIFECFYLYMGKRKNAIISLILCILSFKRISMLAAIAFFIFSKWIVVKKAVNKKIVIVTTVVFVLLPVLTCLMLNDTFEAWFYQTFHVTLNEITLTRSSRIEAVINSGQIKYGLGSVTTYLTKYLNALHGSNFSNRNLHNDLVKIYLECGILGSIVFTYIYMKAASVSRMLFVMMCYIFFECYFNHLFGAGSTDIWILIYLIMSIAGMTTRNAESDGGENGANNGLYTDI
ncbi:O-antigen ligase family protein [Hominifimenecus microfluidus]|uniref:O-antigen ligase family protein n=1 Tax=Hominifimenecus microfluidus TaxID=2885348 RepID=UPI003035A4D8